MILPLTLSFRDTYVDEAPGIGRYPVMAASLPLGVGDGIALGLPHWGINLAVGETSFITQGSRSVPLWRLHRYILVSNNGMRCGRHTEQKNYVTGGGPLPECILYRTTITCLYGACYTSNSLSTMACVTVGSDLPYPPALRW